MINKESAEINIVGSSTFGIYPKISLEKTYNMYISDEWLVNYAGFKKAVDIFPDSEGRALFNSVGGGFLIAVTSSTVYRINKNLSPVFIGNIQTNSGDVDIDENLTNQICIVDGENAYIYNYENNTFTKQNLTFLGNPIIPNDVCYHNSFFLISSSKISINPQNWYAFERDTDSTIKLNSQFSIQTKPDTALSVQRLPGRGNNILVLGETVAEIWTQVGGSENYRRVQSSNIDSGIVAKSTIAASEEVVCWLSQNQNNSPSIITTDSATTRHISTDGIDHVLSKINFPEQSTAFFYRQDGHLFYQLTFYNKKDNLSLIYDFNTQKFFHVSDENLNFHPARQVVFFNKNTYFISLRDSNIYQMDNEFITYDYNIESNSKGEEIPRIRICNTIRKKDSKRFRINKFTFFIEQGVNKFYLLKDEGFNCNNFLITENNNDFIITQDDNFIIAQDNNCPINDDIPRVDMSFSKNGNQSFSNIVSKNLNTEGNYRNQITWWRIGQANEFTIQLRFWGFQRFVCSNGILDIY